MHKLPYSLLSFLFFVTSAALAQSDIDPQAIYYQQRYALNTEQNILDNPPYLNIDLTNQIYPQNEPTVRIKRGNPNIVVAAWRDFRLGYNPAIRRIGYSYSTNGGLTWSVSQLLPDPMPGHATQSDPVLVSDNNGYFYLSSTSRDPSNTRGETVVYRSTNNGVTFTELATAVASNSFEDKEWLTCDLVPGSPYFNNLYITWTRIGSGIRFVKSTNGGLNWAAPVNVGDNTSGQGSNVAVGTNFYIYVVWGGGVGVRFDKSTNGGVSFGTDYNISTVSSYIGFPFICVDNSNRSTRGNVYVVWDDNRSGNYDVWFQKSSNAGATWLASPVRINDVATNNQYKPAIQCDTNGTICVIYYDERLAPGQVNSYFAYSTDAGSTWNNSRLSDSSFTLTYINSQVRNGEYIGIDAYSGKVVPVWTDDRRGTPNQEIYTAIINTPLAAENNNRTIPEEYALSQNYPNPFNPSTTIKFDVPSVETIHELSLRIYDILGRQVAVLVNEELKPGTYEVQWDGTNYASGIYFYTLKTSEFIETKKMLLVK